MNRLRYVLEELLPPALRDSPAMRWLFRRYWGSLVDDLERFRANIHLVSEAEYADIYSRMPRIQCETDNSLACVERIIKLILPGEVCDVGCGTGHLLRVLGVRVCPATHRLTGVDFQVDEALRSSLPEVELKQANIETLPFQDGAFDTVICTHVLEHVLDLAGAIGELRRVCRGRLIVVVPLEREYRFTFNPHVHFFPYPHSFLRHIAPLLANSLTEVIGRDLLYVENRSPQFGNPQAQPDCTGELVGASQ